jgi:hypothetical protein
VGRGVLRRLHRPRPRGEAPPGPRSDVASGRRRSG